jgi:hypothetical protein
VSAPAQQQGLTPFDPLELMAQLPPELRETQAEKMSRRGIDTGANGVVSGGPGRDPASLLSMAGVTGKRVDPTIFANEFRNLPRDVQQRAIVQLQALVQRGDLQTAAKLIDTLK